MIQFEQQRPDEAQDIAAIVNGILTVQKRFAAAQSRPLARGTHAKGTCVRAQFEVFDLRKTVANRQVAERLARGIYARPGVYSANVRFANGASTFNADSKGDVRALSFSIDLPAGVAGPNPSRQDFTMNNATTFPLNDARAFAAYMNTVSASNKLMGFLSLSPGDMWRVIQTAVRGLKQTRPNAVPYQQMRYWSNVPFAHGPAHAVKYSAMPLLWNPARPLGDGPNRLQDELLRHVNEDARMSAFDFGLQLLDAETMTFRGKRREPSFWIENASYEWNETQAPFHTVGRLTLLPKSEFEPSACAAWYIDVTQNSTPDTKPLGSINRARWAAESASRHARLGTETAPGVRS